MTSPSMKLMRIWIRIKEGMKQAGENSKRASESAKGIDSIKVPDDVKESVGDVKTPNGWRERCFQRYQNKVINEI